MGRGRDVDGWRDANMERDGEDEGCVHMLHMCVYVCVCVYVVCVVCSLFHD